MTAICILTRLRFWLNVILNNVPQSLLCSAILYNAQQYGTLLSNVQQCSAIHKNTQQYATMLSDAYSAQ